VIDHTIPASVPAMPVRRYIRRAWPLLPEHALRSAFQRRDVKINGVRCAPDATVRGGDRIAIYTQAEFPLEVLFDDGKLLAAVKPRGLPVDVDRDGIGADTLLLRLRARHADAQLLHRLDAQVGGVILAALDADTLEQGLAAFRARALKKTYRAIASGAFDRREGTWSDHLLKDAQRSTVRVVARAQPGSKPIETRYRVLDDLGGGFSLVELEPVTGRTHQLRAQMAHHGHPLLGDDKYGDRARNIGALCLWCREIEILDGPLGAYAGRIFAAAEPDWREALGRSADRL
jgi:23S rRNA-/tRNA-specific pseudouridylate synthase